MANNMRRLNQDTPFESAEQMAGKAIENLYSKNPAKRSEAVEVLNGHAAFHGRQMAYQPALELYPNETDPVVKKGLIQLIAYCCRRPKDSKAYNILASALEDTDPNIQIFAIQGLINYGEKAAVAFPTIRAMYANPSVPGMGKRLIMRYISEMGTVAEPVYGIVTSELASPSRLQSSSNKGCS